MVNWFHMLQEESLRQEQTLCVQLCLLFGVT